MIKALTTLRVAYLVLAEPTNCTVFAADPLIPAVKLALPDEFFIASAGRWWDVRPDGDVILTLMLVLISSSLH